MADDPINHPSHYNNGDIETIDAIEAWGFGLHFCVGNAIKYLSRFEHKGAPLEDLRKARWYVERAIAQLEKRGGRVEVANA